MSNRTSHKWDMEDRCIFCGLERRAARLSYGGGMFFGRKTYEFLIENKWQFSKIKCAEYKQLIREKSE